MKASGLPLTLIVLTIFFDFSVSCRHAQKCFYLIYPYTAACNYIYSAHLPLCTLPSVTIYMHNLKCNIFIENDSIFTIKRLFQFVE